MIREKGQVTQALDKRGNDILGILYTKLNEEDCLSCGKKTLDKETIMKAWKKYTTADGINVTETVMKTNKSKTILSHWNSLVPERVNEFTDFTT